MSDRRDELEAGLAAVARPDRRGVRRRRPGPGRGPAGRGHQDLPGLRRPAARRARVTDVGENRTRRPRPRPPSCADLDLRGTSSAGSRATRRRAVAAYADVVAVRRPAQAGRPALARGAPRSHPVDVLLQVSLDPPGQRAVGRRGPLATCAELAAAVDERRHAPAARPDGRRAARRGPRRGVRTARRGPGTAFLADHPSATWLSAGMSGDLEHGDRSRRDTRACRLRGPRFEAPIQ